MKKSCTVLLFLLVSGVIGGSLRSLLAAQQAAQGPRIGFINAQKVLDASTFGKRVKQEMDEYVNRRKALIDEAREEIRNLNEEFARQEAVLSSEARRVKREEIERKVIEAERNADKWNREIQGKMAELLGKFYKRLEEVVKSIAEKRGYSFVFDRNAEARFLLYAKESFDITQEVVEEYERQEK